VRDIPNTLISGARRPSRSRLCKAGINLRLVKSPDAPKITRLQAGALEFMFAMFSILPLKDWISIGMQA
jgi:hypothetical protein